MYCAQQLTDVWSLPVLQETNGILQGFGLLFQPLGATVKYFKSLRVSVETNVGSAYGDALRLNIHIHNLLAQN